MKPFQHSLFPKTELTDVVVDGKRVYDTPEGKFKSVTTIIGESFDKTWLDEWRKRVGEDEAEAIRFQAGGRGTEIHNLAEKYVMNDSNWVKGSMPVNVYTFKKIAPVLDEGLDVVYGVEFPLYSSFFQTAGRTDLPAKFQGRNSIVDFKTSRRPKNRDDIPHYFVQAGVYALMFEEMTGQKMPWVDIIMAIDEEDYAQVFTARVSEWYSEISRVFIKRTKTHS